MNLVLFVYSQIYILKKRPVFQQVVRLLQMVDP